MKYFGGRGIQAAPKPDPKKATAFLKKLGVTAAQITEAKKTREKNATDRAKKNTK